ncbi:MAG TPA: histidine kinase [Streptosporangiaceae bacterium]|jgi:signal transduction histidine kinase
MATMAAAARGRRAARAPLRWAARIIGDVVFVVAGVPVQLAALIVAALPCIVALVVPVSWPLVLLGLVPSALAAVLARGPLTLAERHRFWSLRGLDLPRSPAAPGRTPLQRLTAALLDEATWRQLCYHLVVGPLVAFGGLLTLGMVAGGAGLAATLGYQYVFPPLSAIQTAPLKLKIVLTVAGAAVLLAAPAVAALVTWIDTRAGTVLLGPSRSYELERRVESLAESRAGVVDAADTERRRIERDLHDGAQQRLVSLAINLGMARENLTDLPEAARQVIAEAHDEAKAALAELRSLVRGLHPAVLDDRGLDAALSGIAARAPLPVTLHVDVPRRASPTVEAVAYFVVSECLANIARHAAARRAEIDVRRAGDLLRIRITDDGAGGADPARGTGLGSLAQRARSVDGTMRIDSPAGGPTRITVELPCGS